MQSCSASRLKRAQLRRIILDHIDADVGIEHILQHQSGSRSSAAGRSRSSAAGRSRSRMKSSHARSVRKQIVLALAHRADEGALANFDDVNLMNAFREANSLGQANCLAAIGGEYR